MNRSKLKQTAIQLRQSLLQNIHAGSAAEAAARCWFSRLTALRYMEVNGYLSAPLFTDENGCLRREEENAACRAAVYSACRMLRDCTVLFAPSSADALLPENLLHPDGAAAILVREISPDDWQRFPELLGWLYQYYNIPERELVLDGLRKKQKIAPSQIPAATQMFTPDWIVRYMTQNALGTLTKAPSDWKYYLPSPELETMHTDAASLTVLDPCMGTGHILSYVFDALMELLLAEGMDAPTAARHILAESLYGMDIDADACALADFVLRMKAMLYDPEILSQNISLHLCHFAGLSLPAELLPDSCRGLAAEFENAHTFGSLLRPVCQKLPEAQDIPPQYAEALSRMKCLYTMLNRRYHAVITNPPYMGSSSMDSLLSSFMKACYPDSRSDLFAAFMERCGELTAPEGCFAMITQHAWMFLSSYRKLRQKMRRYTLQSMVHLGAKAFSSTDVGTIVQTAAFVCLGRQIPEMQSTFIRLTETDDKETAFFQPSLRYRCKASRFEGIPGQPLCYWVSDSMLRVLKQPVLGDFCKICQGMTTSDNKRFLRRWYEVPPDRIAFGCRDAEQALKSGKRWFPYNKGGRLRKWYGNNSYVVNYYRNGEEMRIFHAELNKAHTGGRIKNSEMFFKPAVTWPFITESIRFGVRYQPEGFLFDVSGSSLFPEEEELFYLMGLLSSKVVLEILKLYNPTMNFQVENIRSLPVIFDRSRLPEINRLVQENIRLAREDWDSSEESWDFSVHPLVWMGKDSLADACTLWEHTCRERVLAMQRNESQLNRIFAAIYGLEKEISTEVPLSEITLHHISRKTAAQSLVSFAVGCLFGRYSVSGFPAISGNFLPLSALPDYLRQFLTAVYGREKLSENIAWLTDALGETGAPDEALRHYCMVGFYPDHCRCYHRRPVYWLASSGTKHTLHGLCFMHRMGAETISELLAAADAHSSRELAAYRKKLQAVQESGICFDPDAGTEANHAAFREIFAAIR